MINVISIAAGAKVALASGATGEVVENIGDGQWLSVRYLTSPDESIVGEEELCHASDIVSVEDVSGR